LSPLLANVLLDDVDKALGQRGLHFVRYADDCNVYVRSKRAAERVMEGLVGLYAGLKLRVNVAKSAVARAWERSFLGFSFWVAPGKIVKRRVAPKALTAMKERLREITSRNGGRSVARVASRRCPYGTPEGEESDFAGMNEEWVKWFPIDPPARQAAKLPVRIPKMLISIAAMTKKVANINVRSHFLIDSFQSVAVAPRFVAIAPTTPTA